MKDDFRIIVARDADRVIGVHPMAEVTASDHEEYPAGSLISFVSIAPVVREGYAVLVIPRPEAERQKVV